MSDKENINEALMTTVSRSTKTAKLERLGGEMALHIAKQNNDPMYIKYIKFNTKRKKIKEMIMKKYGQRGAMAARKAASQSR